VRGGGYDKVFWTSEDSSIAQTYIPVSGSFMYLSSSSLSQPSTQETTRKMQKQIGINYTNIENRGNTVTSYKEADVFEKISDYYYNVRDRLFKLENLLKKTKGERYEKWESLTWEEKGEWAKKEYKIEEQIKKETENYHKSKIEKIKNEFVNKKLEKLGYKPIDDFDRDGNYNWKIKIEDNKIMPENYRMKGRLLII
jgi:hypothetical protein